MANITELEALPRPFTLVDTLPVMEAFYTLQGEGAFMGQAAWFIRLGGCDVGCHWCDVKESWDASAHPQRKIEELLAEATAQPGRLAVITGGEPLMHNLDALTATFQQAGFRTHIETSGAHPMSGTWDWVTLSPKKFKPCLPSAYATASELKVVVYHPSDIAWAQSHADRVGPNCLLYLQPEWSRQEEVTPLIIAHIMAHPRWRISLQTHKYMAIP